MAKLTVNLVMSKYIIGGRIVEIQEKVALLNKLDTAQLFRSIQEAENRLEQALKADALYRNDNVRYLGGYSEDCDAVKAIIAELTIEPPLNTEGKKATVSMMGAWLTKQRDTNPTLLKAIDYQNQVSFQLETNRITIDMAKKRLESLKGLMGLRTAQIEFLK
jgi:hypothetical protein